MRETRPKRCSRLVGLAELLKRPRLVEVRVAVVRIGLERAVVPLHGLKQRTVLGMLLAHAVQAEGILRLRVEHLLEQGDSFAGGHGGRVAAPSYDRGMSAILQLPRLARAACPLMALVCAACDTTYTPVDRTDRRPRELQVTDVEGGTHWRTIVVDGRWYQSLGPELLVVSSRDASQVVDRVRALPLGRSGALVDMVDYRGDIVAVLDRTAVVRIDRSSERKHVVTELMLERDLGLRPEELSVADGGLFVSGLGGIVRLDTGERFVATPQRYGRVVRTAKGLAATCGKDVVLIDDGSVVGLATDLQPMPEGIGPEGSLAFVLQQSNVARVGIKDAALHDLAAAAVPGEVRRVRVLDGRLWAVGPAAIETWRIASGEGGALALEDHRTIAVRGALDIDMVAPNSFAVAGTFGRSLYRLDADDRGASDQFYSAVREPGRLDTAYGDQRRIMAGSDEGMWVYTMGAECELTPRELRVVSIPKSEVSGPFGTARIEGTDGDPLTVDQGHRVIVSPPSGTDRELGMPQGSMARTLESVDGDLWIGHDDGIDVWRPSVDGLRRVARIRMQGPVMHIFPRRVGNSAGFVSVFGGMGVVEWKPVDAATELPQLPQSQPSRGAPPSAQPPSRTAGR